MKDYPNREALRKAHDIYRDVMRPFIVRCLKRIQGATVEELVRDSLDNHRIEQFEQDLQRSNGSIEAAIDISIFPNIIGKYWKWPRGFSQEFGLNSKVQYKTGTIVEVRNLWAHPPLEDVDPERTRAALTHVAEVLDEIGKTKAREAVENIRNRLFSDEPEEHPVEVENADLKKHLANRDDELKAEKEQHQDTRNKLAKMEGMEAEWLEMDERCKVTLKELTDARAENAELKERLSETENRPKVIELESDEHIKTLTDKTELEERRETTSIKEWRRKIWKQLCNYAAQKDTPVRFNKPGSENYLNVSRSLIDLTGFYMKVWLGKDNREITIRLYMSKQNFYILEKQRKEIEQEFCESFEWEKLPQRRESRISLRKDIINPTDESDWQNQHEWVISKLEKFHKKFNEVFLPRIQELNTSDSLLEDEEYLPLNPATPNSVTFQGTTFVKHLDEYRVAGDDITQNFWHYWQSQGREGKQEMRNAGWSVEKIDGEWKVTVSPEDFQAWIENEVTELNSLLNSSQNEEPSTQPPRLFYGKTVLPTGKEMEQPALEFLSDGREYPRIEIINVLTQHFSLTKNQREQLSRSGRVELYLRNKDLIERTRTGYYRITDLGLQVLKQNLDDVPF